MLEIEELFSGYIKGSCVLKKINLQIKEAELISVIGVNGSGKTTLLKTIVGMLKTSGKVYFMGEDITNLKTHKIIRKGVRYVMEGRKLFGDLTVKENIKMGGYLLNEKDFVRGLEFVSDIFPILKERINQRAKFLSGGEQQMVALARALVSFPKLLLLDEPTMGLSPLYVEMIFEKIKLFKEHKTTILLVEQNAKKAMEVADFVYILQSGEIVHKGTSEELKNLDDVKKIYLGG